MTNFLEQHIGGGYESDIPRKDNVEDFHVKDQRPRSFVPPASARTSSIFQNVTTAAMKRKYALEYQSMSAYDRHKKFIHDYVRYYGRNNLPQLATKTDHDVLKEEYRFIRTEDDNDPTIWEKRFAQQYYEKLFRNYCLADLSRYKEGKVGMRWRVQSEVFEGKGQFVCGNLQCSVKDELKSYEVNFAYVEAGMRKNALVKLRLCPECGVKLNYRSDVKKKAKLERKLEREKTRARGRQPVEHKVEASYNCVKESSSNKQSRDSCCNDDDGGGGESKMRKVRHGDHSDSKEHIRDRRRDGNGSNRSKKSGTHHHRGKDKGLRQRRSKREKVERKAKEKNNGISMSKDIDLFSQLLE